MRGSVPGCGTDGLDYVACENGFYLPVAVVNAPTGKVVQVLQPLPPGYSQAEKEKEAQRQREAKRVKEEEAHTPPVVINGW
jgi:hypothetical protein